jgi:hypothetical protein
MAQQLTSTEVNRAVTLREEEHSQLYVAWGCAGNCVESFETIPKNRYRNKVQVQVQKVKLRQVMSVFCNCKPFEIAHILRGTCKNI